MRLKNKVAIVTGGSQGIGKAFSLSLLEEGAKVVVAVRDILKASWINQAADEKGGEVLIIHTDISEEESTKKMADKTIEHFGKIDILINNAGISSRVETKPFYEISAQEWDKIMQVNLKGTFLCSKAVYPQMKKQGKGKIINVSSAGFFKGVPLFLHYISSKGGIIALTRALAREVGGDGISVNAIAPGFTLTDEMRKQPIFNEEFVKANASSRCFKRIEVSEDVTGAMVFLASDDSDFITGQTVVVDGGSVLH